MPSFSRLLILSVLSVSLAVQSAPVRETAGTDLANVVVTERDVVAAPVDEFDEVDEVDDVDDVEDDLSARDLDEGEEGNNADDADDDNDDSTLERRAGSKSSAKTTKKTTPKTTTPKKTTPKTTTPKVTTPKKTTPKTTTPKKTTPKKTTPKTTTPKTTTPKTTSPKKACPIKTKTGTTAKGSKTTKKARLFERAIDYVAHLVARTSPEFVGWHGTNSDTAAFWQSKGQLEKPTKADGFFDFIGLGPKTSAGTSGADAEIGPGVYVTDDKDIAIAFANNNAKVNPGTTPQLCAIFAKSTSNWRTALRKSFIPETLVGDSSDAAKKAALEKARIDHVKKAVPGVSAQSVVKFSLLNRKTKSGQLVIPATITNQFTAQCVDVSGTAPSGSSSFPAFSYNGATLRSEWAIAAEDAGEDCA